ncbi:MAG: thermonuclease family protein [Alphaproteobacteria bacterium]|nr:thermonuclease family protein [Alphaproteobacteria bacterium]MBU6472316.1 thermonuclease family protein [Alphaproteobacteria bacterium]MDE2014242.1 thermonuclease family protein [Alphaproteobacteria bacterium]MDE2072870.1 thermonuclease family protein [Alphaproteobacteria bacterium]
MRSVQLWSFAVLGAGLLILGLSAANPASDTAPPGYRVAAAAFDGPVRAEVLKVIDGDTFEATAHIWLGEAIDVHVRIEGIDAPELHARCDDERTQAEAARDYLARRIGGGEVELSNVRYDKYGGRVDATVEDARGDVGRAMIAAGHARPYHGERRQPWCSES